MTEIERLKRLNEELSENIQAELEKSLWTRAKSLEDILTIKHEKIEKDIDQQYQTMEKLINRLETTNESLDKEIIKLKAKMAKLSLYGMMLGLIITVGLTAGAWSGINYILKAKKEEIITLTKQSRALEEDVKLTKQLGGVPYIHKVYKNGVELKKGWELKYNDQNWLEVEEKRR
jgi:tetrahydromethanopterin S-methyltransferase subunit B